MLCERFWDCCCGFTLRSKMKSIEIMDRFMTAIFLSSRIDPRLPMYKQMDKIPKSIVDDLKDVKSDELGQMRPDLFKGA